MEADREIASLLRAGRWFGGLPAALQNLIIERSVRKSYRKGEYIVSLPRDELNDLDFFITSPGMTGRV